MAEFERLVKDQLKMRRKAETDSVELEVERQEKDPRVDRLEKYLQTLPTGEEYRETLREIGGLREFCASQCSTIVSLNARIEQLSKENAQRNAEIKNLNAKNDDLQTKELQSKPNRDVNAAVQREYARAKGENEKLKKQIERIRANIKTQDNENSIKTEELESRIKVEAATVEELRTRLSEIAEDGESVRKTMKEMAAKQADLMDENCFLTEQLRKFQMSATRRIHAEDKKTIGQIDTCFKQLKSTVSFFSAIMGKSGKGEDSEAGNADDNSDCDDHVGADHDEYSKRQSDLLKLEREIQLIKQKASSITAKQISDKLDCTLQ